MTDTKMRLHDVVAVIGLKNPSTDLAEVLCQSLGIDVFYAVKKSDPTRRIDSLADEAIVIAPFDQLSPSILRIGLMAPDLLFAKDELDCNMTNEREMFGHLLGWLVYRITSESDLPEGWRLLDAANGRPQEGFDSPTDSFSKGKILAGGRVVVNFGSGNRLMQLPDSFSGFFSAIEGFAI